MYFPIGEKHKIYFPTPNIQICTAGIELTQAMTGTNRWMETLKHRFSKPGPDLQILIPGYKNKILSIKKSCDIAAMRLRYYRMYYKNNDRCCRVGTFGLKECHLMVTNYPFTFLLRTFRKLVVNAVSVNPVEGWVLALVEGPGHFKLSRRPKNLNPSWIIVCNEVK